MKVLKVATYDWKNASRDKRELSLYRELGHDVYVLCKGNKNDYLKRDNVDGFDVFRCTTRPLGSLLPRFINRIVSTIMWVKCIMKINPDVISGENPNGAFIGVLAKKIIRNKNIKLIYDAHEFHLFAGKISNLKRTALKLLEKYILKNADLTIVVNNSILDEMTKIYNFKWNAISLLSTPSTFKINTDKVKSIREYYDSKINNDHNRFIIEYHGIINKMRSIEILLELLSINTNLSLVLIGSIQDNYKQELINYARGRGVIDRILFHEAVPIYELGNYINAADLGIFVFKVFYKNLYYSLPNKFFEIIQSEKPLICSNFPELRKIVSEYDIGLLADSDNVDNINLLVEKIRTNTILYNKLTNNVIAAKKVYCWENEKFKLKDAFEKIVQN